MQIPIPKRLTWNGYRVRNEQLEPPLQIGLPFYGRVVEVDKMRDPQFPGIEYWGKAVHIFDDVYRCLANLEGTLCVVEVTIRPAPAH